jgi:hypothetical protein
MRYNNNKPVPVSTEVDANHVRSTVSYLNRSFREAAEALKERTGSYSNVKGSELYGLQVEFSYLIDEIQRGPIFMYYNNVSEAKKLISSIETIRKGA